MDEISRPCPCGTGKTYGACCGRYHSGAMLPLTAEQLMRSRYAAYALSHVDYLEDTLAPKERRNFDRAAAAEWCAQTLWTGLEITGRTAGGPKDKTGTVTFAAHYIQGMRAQTLHEHSLFERVGGKWRYVRAL